MPLVTADMDAAGVVALWEEMRNYYGNLWAKMHDASALYEHNFSFLADSIPEGVEVHEPSTASSIIDHFRDNLRIQNVTAERRDHGTSKKARDEKALMLRLDNYIIEKIRESSEVDPFAQVTFDMPLRGAAAWEIRFDGIDWPEDVPEGMTETQFKKERGKKFPLQAVPLDPLDVLPAPGGAYPMPWCLTKELITADEGRRRYGSNWLGGEDRAPGEELLKVTLWSAPYKDEDGNHVDGIQKVILDEELVLDRVNPFGVVPIVYEYSGLGRVDYRNDPATLGVNLLEKAASELIAEARLKTSMDAVWQFTAFPRLMVTESPGDIKIRWDLSSGGILQVSGLAPDQKPQWLEQPQVDAAMWNFLPLVQKSIERATYSSVLEGGRQPGVDFGYLQALLVGQASLRKDNIVGMASRLYARGIGLIERIMVHLDIGPITLAPGTGGEDSRQINPSDIKDRYDVRVVVEASDPAERDRRMLAWLSPLRAGVISKLTYLRNGLMIEDPDEELDRIYSERIVEQIINSGAVAMEILETIQAEERADNLETAANEQVQKVRGAVEGQPGVPPQQESKTTPSPLSVVANIMSDNQRATSLERP